MVTVAFLVITVLFQNCDSQELRVSTSRSGYPKKRTLPLTEDFCLIVSKMRKICNDSNRATALEEHYENESPLVGGNKHLECNIVRGEIHFKLPYQPYLYTQILMWRTTVTCDLDKRLSTIQTPTQMELQKQLKTCLKRQLPDMQRTICLL